MILLITISVLTLLGCLFSAFASFDRLVKLEYGKHKDCWVADGKPMGLLGWRSGEGGLFKSALATNILSFVWLFSTPGWALNDSEARRCLTKLRWCVLIWNIGFVACCVVALLMSVE